MQKKYPFKFLESYQREDADMFFGRKAEVDALYEMVFQTDLLLLYGASGTGKTSLIQCGLASRFATHDWMPLFVRRGQDLNTSLENALIAAGGDLQTESDELAWLEEDFSSDTPTTTNSTRTLSPLSRRLRAIYLRHFKPIYLIFDQFEELYILGSRKEQDRFVETVQDILRVEQPVKIIISIREEYLGYLYEFEREVPELLRKKLRVEPMNLEKVKSVVQGIARLPQSNVHLAAGEEAAIAESIFEKIRGEQKTLSIQLPYLQVFLDKLYMRNTGDESRLAEATFSLATLAEVGDIGDVLRDFLDEQVLNIARKRKQETQQLWSILSSFVTLEGTKAPLSEAQLRHRLEQVAPEHLRQSLQDLVQYRILRYNQQAEVYEIMHDSLAKQIHAKRSDDEIALLEVRQLVKSQTALHAEKREYFSRKQLNLISDYRENLKLSEEEENYLQESERVQRKRRLMWITIGSSLAAIVLGLMLWALWQQGQTALANKDLLKAQDATENALTIAEQERDAAQKARDEIAAEKTATEEQRNLAQSNSELAKQATKQANSERDAAQKARDQIATEQAATEEQRNLAQNNFERAEQATKEANTQRDKSKLALLDLQARNKTVVDLLLENAERDVVQLRYDAALTKIKTAADLEVKQAEVAKAMLEMAFWHNEVGNSKRALGLLDSTAALLNTPLRVQLEGDSVQALRNAMQQLDKTHYAYLFKEKYYPQMLPVPGGTFWMGCDTTLNQRCQSDETWHQQSVSDFKMAKHETTWWQYYLFCEASKHEYETSGWGLWGDNPAVNVSWYDAILYSNWLNNQMGLDTTYVVSNKREGTWGDEYDVEWRTDTKAFQLPTEAQWEYATKEGKERSLYVYSGSNAIDSVAWYNDNSKKRTQAVGQKLPNALGLHDLSGNVWEWCWDWKAEYSIAPLQNYRGPEEGSYRILRGGSWSDNINYCRSSDRYDFDPDDWVNVGGFRLIGY